jgi:hypothetical protein
VAYPETAGLYPFRFFRQNLYPLFAREMKVFNIPSVSRKDSNGISPGSGPSGQLKEEALGSSLVGPKTVYNLEYFRHDSKVH